MDALSPPGGPADPVGLARDLIRCASVTPEDAGALAVAEQALTGLGFTCHRLRFSAPGTPDVDNLYARRGAGAPHFCFAGHTDVVPPGDRARWSVDPFEGRIEDGVLFGRGAADMKGAVAAFIAACARFLDAHPAPSGSISLLLTGDEEGPAINGTVKVLDWLKARGEIPDVCLVGEPTNPHAVGEAIKVGRRGSLNAKLTVLGVQGHVAYPHLADNPLPRLLRVLHRLTETPLDAGSAHFQPSSLQVTTIDVGNPATNVIPARASAGLNIRFNDLHTGESLSRHLRAVCDELAGAHELALEVSGESFLTPPGPLIEHLSRAITAVTGRVPELSTSGGTSDARFIRSLCPVAEFGLTSQTMHKVDERVSLADLETLTAVYQGVLAAFVA